MKQLFRSWAALALLPPLLLIAALMVLPSGCGSSSSSGTPTPTMGYAEVGFIVANPSPGVQPSPSLSDFQHILLNVISVRVNPSSGANCDISEVDPNWEVIPAPSGIGQNGELQIDLNPIQNQVQLFNTGAIRAQSYRELEIVLDGSDPGEIWPNCPSPGSSFTNEGCLAYRIQLPFGLHVCAPASGPPLFQITNHGVSPFVVNINPVFITPPTTAGGIYTLDLQPVPADFNTFMGQISGTVTGEPDPASALVTAELSGTNSVIAQAHILNGSYALELPAAAGPSGTAYDVFVSGGGGSYAAKSAAVIGPVTRGGLLQGVDLVVTSENTGTLSGAVTDGHTGSYLGGSLTNAEPAALNLLIPSQGTSGVDCSQTPSECVVVATANTDATTLQYPLPGNIVQPAPFSTVPLGTYGLQVSAAGYDTLTAKAVVSTSGGAATCGVPPAAATSNCNFSLTSTTISGQVSIDTTAGSEVPVLVMAEDSGTNKLENVVLTTIPLGATVSLPFSMNVPTSPASFDLFASAVDSFNGDPKTFPGHTIAVASGIAGGTDCDGADGSPCLGPMTCVGHASVSGSIATTPDSGTTVVMSKDNVRLFQAQVGPAGSDSAGMFSLCAPPDTYTLQRFENGVPAGSPTTTAIPAPQATSTPCPGICSLTDGTCPGLCQNESLSSPLQ